MSPNRKRFGAVLLACLTLLEACARAPVRNFSVADLLIGIDDMPSEWHLAEDGVNASIGENEGQASGASVAFSAESSTYYVPAVQRVYRYSSSGKAASHYARFERTIFNDASVYRTTSWQEPADFGYSSLTADRSRFACAGSNFSTGSYDGEASTNCVYLAQYEEFLVEFRVKVEVDDQRFFTTPQLARVVEAIDQKMSEQLGQDQ